MKNIATCIYILFRKKNFNIRFVRSLYFKLVRSIHVRRRGRISAKFIARFHRVRCKSFSRGESSTIRFDTRQRSISSRDIVVALSRNPSKVRAGAARGYRIKCYKLQRRRGSAFRANDRPLISHNFPRAYRPIYHIIGRDVYPLVRAVGVLL